MHQVERLCSFDACPCTAVYASQVLAAHYLGGALLAGSMQVMATLLVVGTMDTARADILGLGNLQLTLVEELSQVGHQTLRLMHSGSPRAPAEQSPNSHCLNVPPKPPHPFKPGWHPAGGVLLLSALCPEVGSGRPAGQRPGEPVQPTAPAGQPCPQRCRASDQGAGGGEVAVPGQEGSGQPEHAADALQAERQGESSQADAQLHQVQRLNNDVQAFQLIVGQVPARCA